MDLLNLTSYIWNIFLLFLFFPPGITLERTETKTATKGTKKTFQPDLTSIISEETIRKMLTTPASTPSTTLAITKSIPTITKKMLSSLERTTTAMTQTTTTALRALFAERNARNYTIKQEQQHNHFKAFKSNGIISADNSHELFKSNTTTMSKAANTRKHMDEHEKETQNTKSVATFATDFHNKTYDVAQEHAKKVLLHVTPKVVKLNGQTKSVVENLTKIALVDKNIISDFRLTKTNIQNPFVNKYTLNPFVNFYNDQHKFQKVQIPKNVNTNEIYFGDPNVIVTNTNNILQQNNHNDSGQTASTVSTAYKTNNGSNKSNQATAVTSTTKNLSTFAKKENHMYDNYSALPYKSAALKASAPVIKTMSSSLHAHSNSRNLSSRFGSGSSGSTFKRDTLLSLAGVLSTAETTVVDNIKNSSVVLMLDSDDREKTILKKQNNFKSNNSFEHGTLAVNETIHKTATTTAATTKINELSSSLPLNVSATDSVMPTESTTKEVPTTEATTTSTTTSKNVLKTTTRRRKISTTTLKPPPTIDDYQTVTSQAGTHAYLPCNVKQLVKKPISWLRVRDGHILTVDQTTFIADQRFQSVFTVNPERWSLQIKYVQLKDAGIYECQVSTEPKASAIVYLHVVEPKTELIGAPTRHVKAGSQVKLLCIISQALEPPLFINWFYNQKQIYLHNHKGWHTEIERIELPPDTTTTTTAPATTTTTSTTTSTTTQEMTTTTTSASLTSVPSSPLKLSTTTSSMLNGSEISAMHVFTSITPQQSLNDSNLLELVSESTYNKYPKLIKPEAASISTPLKAEATLQPDTNASATATIPTILPPAVQVTTSFDYTTDENNDDYEEDYKIKPSALTFETAEAIAAERGYMMLSSLMTFTDVKHITTASLIIPSVQKQDSGNYTCSPSNSEPRTVVLHVLNGEYSASAITSAALNLHFQFKFFTFNWSIFALIEGLLKNSLYNKQHLINQYTGG